MVLGLILYFTGLASWARKLREKRTTLQRRRLYGVVAALLSVFGGLISVLRSETRTPDVVAFTLGWSLLVGFLGYLTVVHCPKWIVGKYGLSDAERKMQKTRQNMLGNLKS